MGFFGELKRRNVFRVAIAYAVVAWLIMQVADIILEAIGAPAWVMQVLMLLLAVGFIVTTMFAWAYEVTPEGIRRESEVDRSASITHVTGRKLDRIIIGLLVVSLAYFVWEARIAEHLEDGMPNTSVAPEPATDEAEVIIIPASDLSIAVLPFDNRSALAEDAFFADGIHDDLLTTLAKIGSMKVISRTSVLRYASTTKPIPEIAAELGVANILEGAVQRAGNQVRINVQLIDAGTDEYLWAETFDRELTAENLFAIQSEISKAVADALQATLSPDEVRRIDTAPTDSLEAFDRYLKGRQLMATRNVDDLEAATAEFFRAVELDPQFALAWVGVADSHSSLGYYGTKPYGTYFEIEDDAISKALKIDPGLGEAYASLGGLQQFRGDLAAAERSYKQAIRFSPNYATGFHWLSNMLLQNLYRAEEALGYAQRAAELDPNSAIILSNLSLAYWVNGDFEIAARITDRALDIDPDFAQALLSKGDLLFLEGNYVGAIEAERKAAEVDAGSALWLNGLGHRLASIGAFDEARDIARTLGERFPDSPLSELVEISIEIAAGVRPNARSVITRLLEGKPDENVAMQAGFFALQLGQFDLAMEAFNNVLHDDLTTMEYPQEFVGRISQLIGTQWISESCMYAWLLLETPDAEGRGRELLSKTISLFENALPGSIRYPEQFGIDGCYMLAGQPDKALDALESQLDSHFVVFWRWVLQSSLYDPLRSHPRFIELQSRYDARMAEQVAELRREKRPAFEH